MSSMSKALRICAQPSRRSCDDLGLIAHRIEFGLDRVRPRRDLAQRQRGREHLDENDVHRRNRPIKVSRHCRRP